jgi:transcriptional regulator with PAS, ATPase and Fis domain
MLVGSSGVMVELRALVERVGRTSFTVLIEGESGVGKEEVARHIHDASPRRRGPFVAVNCAALVETLLEAELFGIEERTATGVRGRRGKFELAHNGTLFLDEVGDLSPTAQAKLLRVLQDMTVERVGSHVQRTLDTRVVAATNRGLQEMVADKRFRADLYYRLAGVEVVVPPLRERRQDIPDLVAHFLALYGRSSPLSAGLAAMGALAAYDWPGNVRQLARVLEYAIAQSNGDEIGVEHLPRVVLGLQATEPPTAELATNQSLRAWSSIYVKGVLERCNGNKRRACDILDISFHTLKAHLAYGSDRRAAGGAIEPVRRLDRSGAG